MIKNVIFLLAFLLSTACVGTDGVETADKHAVIRNELIQIAERQLKAEKIVLPRRYTVAVEDGVITNEVEPPREIYIVKFNFEYRGRRDVNCTVFIDKRTRKADRVFDSRKDIPG